MIAQDVRFAARTLAKSPGFSLIAIITVALGIGASTAIFSMVNGVLLRRLPYGAGNRLIHIEQPSAANADEAFSVTEVRDYRARARSLDAVAEYHSMAFLLYGRGDPQRVQTGVVSDDFFDLLGVTPLLGRLFRPGEEAIGAPPVVVLSHRYWANVLGSDPNVVGSTFTMNDKIHTVIGVLPPLPNYPGNDDIWMPAGACPFRSSAGMMNSRTGRMLAVFARLRTGATLDQARSELATVAQRLHAEYPEAYPAELKMRAAPRAVREELTATSRPVFFTLFATAAFLLVIATANFANLTLSRQIRRGRELALREALGAGRGRLFRQLATESLLLTLIGGGLGALLAASGLGMLRTLATRLTPRADEITVDPAVLAFTLVASVLVGLVVASLPFLRPLLKGSLGDALRKGNSAAMVSRGEARLRGGLVLAQVTIAFVLLIGAGLIARSLMKLEKVNAGFDGTGVLTARLSLNFTKYNTSQLRKNFADALMMRLEGQPGVGSVALASDFPLNNAQPSNVVFQIAGHGEPAATASARPHADVQAVSPAYFQTVGIPLIRGRAFTNADRDTVNTPVIIGERVARTYWGRQDPIGTRISADSGRHWLTVVGVVGDVRQNGLDRDVTDEAYVPAASSGLSDMRVLMRTVGPVAPVIARLRAAVREIDDHQPVESIQTLEQVRGARLAEPRLTTTLLMSFALVALVLTAAGLAGVVAYTVSQRIPEIAIRMALGADSARILGLIMRQGLAVVVMGLGAGAIAALGVTRFMTALLFQVAPTDVATYVSVAAIILGTAVVACFIPARRAMRADPASVMRSS